MDNQIEDKTQKPLTDINIHEYNDIYNVDGQLICNYCNGDCNDSKECKLKNDDFIESMNDSRFNDPFCFGGNEFCSECGYNELYICCDIHLCGYCNNKCSNGCN